MTRIGYIAPFGSPSGYSQAAADYVLALHGSGADVVVANIGTDGPSDFHAESIEHIRGGTDTADVLVVHAPIGVALSICIDDKAPTALMTTWETDKVPAKLEAALRERYVKIATPSECSAAAFSGPVDVIPHVVTPEPMPAPRSGSYVFYSIGSWEHRKNLQGVIAAYVGEFTADESTELRVLTDYRCNVDDVRKWVTLGLGLPVDELPEISVTVGPVPHREVRTLHAAGDCYVTASRGEAWNLPLSDAVAFGRPAIAPAWGGHQGYFRELRGYYPTVPVVMVCAVPALERKVVDGQVVLARTAPHGVNARQLWSEPDGGELRRMMRRAYSNRAGRGHAMHTAADVAANADRMFAYSRSAVAARLTQWVQGL